MSRRSVIAICIEVAGPELLEKWLDQGWMPNLASIRQDGSWAKLRSLSDISSGSIWPSFTTALMPARHGQFFTHMQMESGSYRVVKKYADDIETAPFWAGLQDAGMRAAIVDVPQSRPLPGFNGVHVVGWGGEYPAWPRSSHPPGLMSEILARFGPHPLAETRRIAARPDSLAACARLRDDLLKGVRCKAGVSRMVLEQGPFDLFLTVFVETHWAMHLLWDTLDPDHPKHDPDRSRQFSSTFQAVLSEIDLFIGETRARHPDADLIVFSLSGMGPNYSGSHLLPEILQRLSMGPPQATATGMGSSLGQRVPAMLRQMDRMVPPRWIESVKGMVPERLWDRWTRDMLYRNAGWSKSRAFCLPNDYSGAIRINLQGREPQGIVALGPAYEAVCDEIAQALSELVDVATGEPMVRQVIRVRQNYAGEKLDELPDLIVIWSDRGPLEAVRSERLGTIRLPSPERRSGAHRNEGFLAAIGPHIVAGAVDQGASSVDLGPTILDLLQLKPMVDVDGHALRWLVRLEPHET